MGTILKVFAFIIALAAAFFGAWIITIPIFFFLFVWPFLRRRKTQGTVMVVKEQPQLEKKSRFRPPVRYILGALLLILALLALGANGTYSPLAFGSMGLFLIFSNRLGRWFSTLKPSGQSVPFRCSEIPFLWAGVAELKLGTREVGKALSVIDEKMIIMTSEKPVAYVVIHCVRPTKEMARKAILGRMTGLTMRLAQLGAYLLPLDGEQAFKVLGQRVKPVKLDKNDWPLSLTMAPYDTITLEPEEGFVKAIGAYVRVNGGRNTNGDLLYPRHHLNPAPLAWEVFRELAGRFRWPNPDGYTTFLSSMFAAREEDMGVRIEDEGSPNHSGTLLVRSYETAPVKLSRGQLRAIAEVYRIARA